MKKKKTNVLMAFVVFNPFGLVQYNNLKPTIQQRCMMCHSETFQPSGHSTNWLDYNIAKKYIDKIEDRVIIKREMPLGSKLSEVELNLFRTWVKSEKKR